MHKKQVLILIFFLSLGPALVTNGYAQGDFESAISSEGLTLAEYKDVTTYYYKDPQPQKLISVLRAVLSQKELISDNVHFGPFAHLCATVAHYDNIFLENLILFKDNYSGIQREVLEGIARDAEKFYSPEPDSPANLDYLWAEFLATGNEEPVKKIISVLDYKKPENESTDTDMLKALVFGAARWSLASNANQHKRVYEIIQKELITAQGQKRQVLEEIIKKADAP
jgi:hypothetical protein